MRQAELSIWQNTRQTALLLRRTSYVRSRTAANKKNNGRIVFTKKRKTQDYVIKQPLRFCLINPKLTEVLQANYIEMENVIQLERTDL